jgi:uncharacterized protein YbcI
MLAEVSEAVVRVHKRHIGKGPTKARTTLCGDVLLTRLEDVLTRAETTAIQLGRAQDVREMRGTVVRAQTREFVREVERITGRRVARFSSEVHLGSSRSLALFVLVP